MYLSLRILRILRATASRCSISVPYEIVDHHIQANGPGLELPVQGARRRKDTLSVFSFSRLAQLSYIADVLICRQP